MCAQNGLLDKHFPCEVMTGNMLSIAVFWSVLSIQPLTGLPWGVAFRWNGLGKPKELFQKRSEIGDIRNVLPS